MFPGPSSWGQAGEEPAFLLYSCHAAFVKVPCGARAGTARAGMETPTETQPKRSILLEEKAPQVGERPSFGLLSESLSVLSAAGPGHGPRASGGTDLCCRRPACGRRGAPMRKFQTCTPSGNASVILSFGYATRKCDGRCPFLLKSRTQREESIAGHSGNC